MLLSFGRYSLRFALLLGAVTPVACMNNGVGRTPPLGWNTWMTCGDPTCGHDVCNEAEVKSSAQALIDNGMQALGWTYVNLDDCWADSRTGPNNTLTWDASRFPSGIPALVDWLHSKGLKFGLYTSAGNQTCSSGGRSHPIPGSRDHYALDAETFAAWGVDYIKFDWCGDIKKELAQGKSAHKEFAAAVLGSSKPGMFLEVVAGYFFLFGEIANYANSWRFCEDHHDSWKSLTEAVTCRVDQVHNATGSPGGWAYMDFLMTGGAGCSPFSKGPHCPSMTDDEYRTEFVLWSLTQSPLIVATDVRNMTPIMTEALLNKELLDIHQSVSTPPGRFLAEWMCDEPLHCQVWGRKLNGDGSDWMVALVNTGKKSHSITVKWSVLGWPKSQQAHIRDLWVHQDIPDGPFSSMFETKVPSHGTTVVRISAAGGGTPQSSGEAIHLI